MKDQEHTERKHKGLKICHVTANSMRDGTDVYNKLPQQSIVNDLFSMRF